MSPDQLRALQAPLKAGYREDPTSAAMTLRARGRLGLDAPRELIAKVLELTERYCVVYQTLLHPPRVEITHRTTSAPKRE
jgi:hypothetical protein